MLPVRELLNSELKARIEENDKQKRAKYSQEIVHNPKTLEMALKAAKHMPDDIPYIIKPECSELGYEDEWSRVQRMRKEKDPLVLGGRRRDY